MLTRFTHTFAFRVTLLYSTIFAVSMTMLLSLIYLAVIREMEGQLKTTVSIQLGEIGIKYTRDGLTDTIVNIRQRIERDREHNFIYLLTNSRGKVLAGNIDRRPSDENVNGDWFRFALYRDDLNAAEWPEVIAQSSRLSSSYTLIVGHKLGGLQRVGDVIMRVIIYGGSVTLLIALLGGALLSRTILAKLSAINDICKRVMSGDLARRVALAGSGDEFDELAKQFNAMLARVSELVDGIRDISSNIAHDLRTPLNRLRNKLETLETYESTPFQTQEELRAAIGEIDDLVLTLNAILRISQAEIGAGIEHFTDVDLSTMVEGVTDLYTPLAEDKDISVKEHIEPNVMVFGDRPLLAQAVANLVDNAVKYTPVRGQIEVVLKTVRGRVNLWVADNGPGIPSEHYHHVRERFFRLEKSRATPGNGLGLSLADAAFRLHHAELLFSDNNPGLKVHIIFAKGRP